MSYLPPVGWADVATKRDLDVLESKLTHRFEAMLHREIGATHREIGTLRSEMVRQTRALFFALAGLMVTLAAITTAAVRLG